MKISKKIFKLFQIWQKTITIFLLLISIRDLKATGINLPQSEWTKPEALQDDGYIDESKMPKDSKYTQLVILGNKILNETTYYVGPQAKDKKKRFAGIFFLVLVVTL